MLARTLMVQGTASSVGKSLLVAALCRLFRQDGYDVAPFKSQNMALNSAVTPDGLEIGRAQAVQAEAAGLAASVDMNPILLKPEGPQRSQVVVLGRPQATLSAREYQDYKPELQSVVAGSLERLRRRHQLVIIEGAGSPAEINLKARDLVNMHVARLADAPVLLVGDIDRGGVFAALVGTLELLEPDERARVAALVINNFRGDLGLLEPGLDFIRQRTGKPVLGVVPHVPRLRIADEDSVSLETRRARRRPSRAELDIVVVRFPQMSNYDDVLELEHECGVTVRFAQEPAELRGADLLILPGSKSTLSDLGWLRRSGLSAQIARQAHSGGARGASSRCWASAAAARCSARGSKIRSAWSPASRSSPGWGCSIRRRALAPTSARLRSRRAVISRAFSRRTRPLARPCAATRSTWGAACPGPPRAARFGF